MFSFKERFGVPGILSVLALVFAMAGGAYAAKGVIITKLSQIKPSVQKQLQGKTGPQGPAGAAGAQGPEGKQGPAGKEGVEGKQGPEGKEGKEGKAGASVVATEVEVGESECEKRGGSKFKVGASPATFACNGKEGPEGKEGKEGKEGSPWVAGQAPAGAVLKGTWTLPQYSAAAAGEAIPVPISTGVPLSTASFVHVAVVPPGPANPEQAQGCTGTAEEPTATNPTFACMYEEEASNLKAPTAFQAAFNKVAQSGGGVVVLFHSLEEGVAKGYGSWALIAQ